MIRSFTSREFNQYVTNAKRAADEGPVLITDRGEPAYALLNIRDYRKLQSLPRSLADTLAMPLDAGDIEFDPVPVKVQFKPADLA